jgi:hypothetical protein
MWHSTITDLMSPCNHCHRDHTAEIADVLVAKFPEITAKMIQFKK